MDVSFVTVSQSYLNYTEYGQCRSIAFESIKKLEIPYLNEPRVFGLFKLMTIFWWSEGLRILFGQQQVIVRLASGENFQFWIDQDRLKYLLSFAEKS